MNTWRDRMFPMLDAEGAAAGGTSDSEAGRETGAAAERTFTQAELDGIVSERLRRAQEKWTRDAKEAQRLEKLTADERIAEELKNANEAVEQLKKENAAILLKQDATALMAQQGLPVDLVENLIGTDAETTKANIEAFSKAFTASVNAAISEKLKTSAPKASGAEDAFLNAVRKGAGIK